MKSTTLVLGAVAAVVLSSGAAFAGTKPATAPTAPAAPAAAASTMAPAHNARSHHRAPVRTPAPAATPKKN